MNQLDIPAVITNLPEVLAFIGKHLDEVGCSTSDRYKIEVAAEEVFTNISSYAYNPEVGSASVRVEILNDPITVEISFIDNGVKYDPLARPDPNTSLSAKERKRGGLGIFMTKKFMDDVNYEYKDGQNILTLTKNVS